ncbi:MAG TPA: diacylglycerol kinase family protein [Gemmatimonadaceae bacterium]|nr:diacylglycerol kinase family protein [Gemmatimonadaceae bacterium]
MTDPITTTHPGAAGGADAARGGAPIPAFVNEGAGTAKAAAEALRAAGSVFDVREVPGDRLGDEVKRAVAAGARRVVVAGGDGSVATVAAAVASGDVEMAVLPGGTLNHFARDNHIPTAPEEAAALARDGRVAAVDVGSVNGRLFLNTSSVGAYVLFVRTRERLERYLGYRVASLVAGVRILAQLRSYRVTLDVDGATRTYRSPIVFIGVGERELKAPSLGDRVAGGRRGLHVIVVRGRTAGRLFAIALAAISRGLRDVASTPMVDAFVVDRCRIELPRPRGRVAVDGELAEMTAPLDYELRRDAVKVVVGEEKK